ncbi:MAG: helix-turn-helix transcriptional regulator [Bacteroidaceae bacterium]|nr:helix-turn-helix transcriptional regulator [Bacteroidaceae bacterium]
MHYANPCIAAIIYKREMICIRTLREARLEKKLTLKETAQFLGISECYCSMLLSGKRRMSLENAEKLSKVLDLSIDEVNSLYQMSKSG